MGRKRIPLIQCPIPNCLSLIQDDDVGWYAQGIRSFLIGPDVIRLKKMARVCDDCGPTIMLLEENARGR